MSSAQPLAILAAGGTGGHLFPAEALAGALGRRGFAIDLATDERGDRYGMRFPARAVHIVPSATFRGKDPLSLARTLFTLARGTLAALFLLRRLKPAVVVGFGGYPSFPPLLAASLLGIPTVLHEQNAVMGRANRRLAGWVKAVALSWAKTKFVDGVLADKSRHVGVPVRAVVREAAAIPYPALAAGTPFHLLVFGGSQGARIFADLMPPALSALSVRTRQRLHLIQQVREEDVPRLRAAFDEIGVSAELATFFQDLPQKIAASHLVISRSGASTVAELAVIGRPAILVPLPHALDNDQLRNAEALSTAGGAIVAEQGTLTGALLAALLEKLVGEDGGLARMAQAAKSVGITDAVERLADLVQEVAAQAPS